MAIWAWGPPKAVILCKKTDFKKWRWRRITIIKYKKFRDRQNDYFI